MEQLTKIQIIEETVEYYSTHRRSIKEGTRNCKYNGPDGLKCAFSRCCTDDSVFIEECGSSRQHEAILLPQYAHILYRDNFWVDIQVLHDRDDFWENNELTYSGKTFVNDIKVKYSLELN